MKAIIVGSTGLVGSYLTKILTEDSRFSEVVSVSRRPLETQSAKLNQVIIQDLSQIKSKSAMFKGDIYFCCLGTTIKDAGSQENFRKVDFDAVFDFAKIAKTHEAQSFILISAMGANSNSSIFYNRVKGEIEEALKDLNFKSLTIFRPGLLIGNRAKFRLGEKIAIHTFQMLSAVFPNSLQKMMGTQIDQLAHRMIEAGIQAAPGVNIIFSKEI